MDLSPSRNVSLLRRGRHLLVDGGESSQRPPIPRDGGRGCTCCWEGLGLSTAPPRDGLRAARASACVCVSVACLRTGTSSRTKDPFCLIPLTPKFPTLLSTPTSSAEVLMSLWPGPSLGYP